jgi:hypothetical protein
VIDCSRKRNAPLQSALLFFVCIESIWFGKAAGPIRPSMTSVEIGYDWQNFGACRRRSDSWFSFGRLGCGTQSAHYTARRLRGASGRFLRRLQCRPANAGA